MPEYTIENNQISIDVYAESTLLVESMLTDFQRLVKKSESGIKISARHSAQVELERTYFCEVLEFLFERTLEDFAKILSEVKPGASRNRLCDCLVLNIKLLTSRIVIESDLCGTIFMDEFCELLARFLLSLERAAEHSPIAA